MRDLSQYRKVEPAQPLQLDRMVVPTGYGAIRGARVYFDEHRRRLKITGNPMEEADTDAAVHNCDANGCGWEHVIATLDISERDAKEFSVCERGER